jgi:hypothetical protein
MLRPEEQATLADTLASAGIPADPILATKLHPRACRRSMFRVPTWSPCWSRACRAL